MKKLFTMFALVIILGAQTLLAQALFTENFDYGTSNNPDILAVSTNWARHSGAVGPAYSSTGLTYNGYIGSNIGGALSFTYGGSGVNDGDINAKFDSVTTTNNIYTSFMVKLDSARATADYFFHVGPRTVGTTFRGRVYAKINGAGYSVSLSKTGTPIVDDATVLNFGQTYLFIVKYSLNTAATNDDVVTLYVYESGIPATEPGSPLVTVGPVGDGVTDGLTSVGSVAVRQGTNTPSGLIDGITTATSWEALTIPVEFTSFSATGFENSVRLSWSTATETNNNGFNVERKSVSGNWENIAFVKGNGTTTSKSNYSYTDQNLNGVKFSYRLKQVDFDGSFSYSKVVEIDLNKVFTYTLNQNYPNPFNPTTTINFSLAKAGNVKLTVYNLLGQEVKSLFNGVMEAGNHTVPFDASNLNSGVYLYKIESGSFVQVRKMTLMK
jgi:hypothetical protein